MPIIAVSRALFLYYLRIGNHFMLPILFACRDAGVISPGEHPEAEECLEDVVDEHGLSALVGRPLPHVPDAGVPAQ